MALSWTRVSRRRALTAAGMGGAAMAFTAACGGGAKDEPSSGVAAPAAGASGQQAGAPARPTGQPRMGGTLKVIHSTDPPTFDVYANTSFAMFDFLSLVYNRLLRFKTGADVDPGALTVRSDLADIPEQPDKTTYVFKLKPGIKWQNAGAVAGRPLVAEDVVYSFTKAQAGVNKSGFTQMTKIEAPDNSTVRITLSEPSAPFLNRLASVYSLVTPKEIESNMKDTAIGTGPFVLKNYQKNASANFVRNPDYFEKGQPYLDGIEYLISIDNSARLAAVQSGQAHVNVYPFTPAEAEQIKSSNPKIAMEEVPGLAGYLFFRTDKPPFNDMRLRQAFSLAMDRPAMVKAIGLGKGVIEGTIPLAVKDWALTPEQMGEAGKFYTRDLKRAKDLYTASGASVRTKLFTSNTYGDAHNTAMEMVKSQMKEIGVDLTIDLQEYSIYISNGYLGKFDEGVGFSTRAFFVDPDEYTYEKFHPKGRVNQSHVDDPKWTELVTKGRQELDRAERKKSMDEAQKLNAEQGYYVHAAAANQFYAADPRVKNYRTTRPYGFEELSETWLES